MTTFVPAVCTSCRARLEVDPSLDAALCTFCRTPYVVARAVEQYDVENTNIEYADTVIQNAQTVHVRKGAVASVVGLVERQLQHKRDADEAKRQEEKRKQEEDARRRAESIARFQSFVAKHWKWLLGGVAVLVLLIVVLSIAGANAAGQAAAPDADGRLTVPNSSAGYEGDDYLAVAAELGDRGFTNVEVVPLGDLITGWLNKPGEVDYVTVAGSSEYSTSQRFESNVPIVIYYHSFPEDAEDAEDAEAEDAEELAAEANGNASDSPSGAADPATPTESAFAEQVRARFLEAHAVDSEIELMDRYIDDPVTPTYAISRWEGVGNWVRVYVQAEMTSAEVLAAGRQILGLTCDDFPGLAGVIVRDVGGVDINVSRSEMPYCAG